MRYTVPADPSQPWKLAYELEAPSGGTLAWVNAYALLVGSLPGDDDGWERIEIADTPDGPWRTIAEPYSLMHPEAPRFNLFGTGQFSGRSGKGYIRFSAKRAARGVRIAAHYQPADVPPEAVPLEIEHAWYEDDPRVGRRERIHIERTDTNICSMRPERDSPTCWTRPLRRHRCWTLRRTRRPSTM